MAMRMVHCNSIKLDPLWTQLQRALSTLNAEKTDAQDRVSELTASNSGLQSAKHRAEQQLANLQEEYEDMETEAKENGNNLKKVMEQTARLQSDNMSAKEHVSSLEKTKVRDNNALHVVRLLHALMILLYCSKSIRNNYQSLSDWKNTLQ